MGVKLVASSGGSVELIPTNTASNFTLTVPAVTATMLTNKTAGTVLQVVQAIKTDVFTANTTTFVDITGLSVSITPTSASNKILVLISLYNGSTNSNEYYTKFNLVRDATNLAQSTGAGAGQRNSTFSTSVNTGATGGAQYMLVAGNYTYLDSPATTSSVTYKVQASGVTSYTSVVINRAGVSNANDYNAFATSTITVMEIAG